MNYRQTMSLAPSACPLTGASCTTTDEASLLESKATTWSDPTQYGRPPSPTSIPAALGIPTAFSGTRHRHELPDTGSYSRTLGTASAAPQGPAASHDVAVWRGEASVNGASAWGR